MDLTLTLSILNAMLWAACVVTLMLSETTKNPTRTAQASLIGAVFAVGLTTYLALV
jgi:hypothetical protein